jgi:integrase
MARQYERLTARQIATITAPGMHADGGGLYLRVDKSGSKAWVMRYAFQGKRHDLGLGPVRLVSLADARRKAADLARQRLDGADPLLERRAKRDVETVQRAKTITFREAADKYIDAQAAGWRTGSGQAEQWQSSLTAYAYPVLGTLPVAMIDLPLVLRVIEPIWTTKAETASRVRARIENVLGWATTHGYRTGDNPARWSGHLENLLPSRSKVAAVEHHAALPYVEIGAFMASLREREDPAARALEFLVLTAARSGEALGARWSEIEMAARKWTVPGARMKGGREHVVPLSDAALACIGEPGEPNALVFPGARAGRAARKAVFYRLMEALGHADVTVHGFRSTFRDWAGDRTAFPREIVEAALAHLVGNAVEQAYRRGSALDQRRRLMEQWAAYCAATEAPAENVIAIRA